LNRQDAKNATVRSRAQPQGLGRILGDGFTNYAFDLCVLVGSHLTVF